MSAPFVMKRNGFMRSENIPQGDISMKNLPRRKATRLCHYDYSLAGCYFITICTHERHYLFGDVIDGEMRLNECGQIAHKELETLSGRYDNVDVDIFVVMPNHAHLILRIEMAEWINPFPTKAVDVPNIIGKYKAGVTRSAGSAFMRSESKIWQLSYHDHIIRNDKSYEKIAKYIEHNPRLWDEDRHNPGNPEFEKWRNG